MRIPKILPTISLIVIMLFSAGCATSNEYVSKLFAPKPVLTKDSTKLAVRFLELDRINGDENQWVKTDIVGKDTTTTTSDPSTDSPVVKTSNQDTRLPIVQGSRTKRTRD